MTKKYELIEAFTSKQMDELHDGISEKLELETGLVIGRPIDIVRYIIKNDLKEYKLVKKVK